MAIVVKKLTRKTSSPAAYDAAWKQILTTNLKDFTEFFWLEAYQNIDWEIQYEILEQELIATKQQDKIGNRYLDKLFKVYLKNGQEQWLLLHVEVQAKVDKTFSERMFIYYERVFNKYHKDVASIAILLDSDNKWRPNQYKRQIWDSLIIREYKIVKLMDYVGKEQELAASKNPFAFITLVHLSAIKTKATDRARLLTKTELAGYLYSTDCKWSEKQRSTVMNALDLLLSLSAEFEIEYVETVKKIEQEREMRVTNSFERYGFNKGIAQGIEKGIIQGMQKGEALGMQKGLEQGMQKGEARGIAKGEARGMQKGIVQGEALVLKELLEAKFSDVPKDYLALINNADHATLLKWAVNSLYANSLAEVFA